MYYFSFPSDSVIKNPPANAEDMGSIPGSGRPPGEGNGQRRLAGRNSWGCKESDTNDWLTDTEPI